MAALDKIRSFFEGMDEKDFYKYLAIFLGVILLIAGLIVFRYYQNTQYYRQRIELVNELREDARQLLEKSLRVEQQRKAVNRMLEEDENFKIVDYLEGLVAKLNLPKPTERRVTETDLDDDYRESTLDVKFTDMNMKSLAELLQEIEQNKRIYSKALEITKSKKQPGTIEVNLTIATLHKKTERT